MVYHFRVRKEDDGYWAECVEIEGCNTQGDTLVELAENASEALNLHLSEPVDSKVIFPAPIDKPKGKHIIAVPVNPRVAMAMRIRQERIKKGLTQQKVATLIGISHIYAYQKLESAKTCNPGLETLVRIRRVFPDLEVDDILDVDID